jgi:ferric-dicitrate binding protein FerR (iron transport regulator)
MNEQIDILISKFLQNQCSLSEIETLKKWIDEKPENLQYFKQIKNLWDSIEIINNSDNIDTELSWNKFTELIEPRKKTPLELTTNKNTISLSMFLRVAALILVSFGLSWIIFYNYYQNVIQTADGMLELTVPRGSKSVLKLADGTTIWLNSETIIKYPDKFSKKQRDVYIEGEAFFEVAKNKKWPFKVHTSDLDIIVLGTSFNVKAYPNEGTIETTLEEGSVLIEKKTKSGKKQFISLKPNQRVTLVKENGDLSYSQQNLNKKENKQNETLQTDKNAKRREKFYLDEHTDTQLYVAWKNNQLIFKNERFESLAIKLERWYNVKIIIKNDKLKNYRFTGTFENETIEQAIAALQLTTKFDYKFEKNIIIIR